MRPGHAVIRPARSSPRAGRHMKPKPLNQGMTTNHTAGKGPVNHGLVHARARELALLAGRALAEVSEADYVQARLELIGQSEGDRQDALLDALPESKRWDPVPGSAGRQAPESPSEDEDEEGRSETEQLVEEGAMEAERDRMLQAERNTGKNQ